MFHGFRLFFIHSGKDACEVRRIPAGEIEGVVVQQLRGALRSPEILSQAVHEVSIARPDISETDAIKHLQSIDHVWDHLFPAEQVRIAHALIERITVRKDGISITGILQATGDPVIVKSMGNLTQQIPREMVKSTEKLNRSLMYDPEQMGLSGQSIADIVAYLKSL